jgi:hypothetical protein
VIENNHRIEKKQSNYDDRFHDILLCFSLCIVGYVSNSSLSASPDNPLSTTTRSGTSTAHNIGETAVLEFYGMNKSVRVVSFYQKEGLPDY